MSPRSLFIALSVLALVAAPTPAAAAAKTPQQQARAPRVVLPLDSDVTPPVFPDSYELSWDFSMPYFMVLQPQGFKYPVRAWVDRAADSVRVDFNGGEQQALFVKDVEYGIYPRKYEKFCRDYKHGGGPVLNPAALTPGGAAPAPRRGGQPDGLLGTPVLPDMGKDEWEPFGTTTINGQEAVQWRLKRRQEGGEKLDEYYFYVTKEGVPLQLHSIGRDLFEGSHYDEYIYDFKSYKPGPIDSDVFKVPEICPKPTLPPPNRQPPTTAGSLKGASGLAGLASWMADLFSSPAAAVAGAGPATADAVAAAETEAISQQTASTERHPSALQAAALLPGAALSLRDHAHYFGFGAAVGRDHSNPELYQMRLAAFTANKQKIQAHNAAAARGGPDAPTHKLGLNRFADWTREEFESVMLPNKRRKSGGGGEGDKPHPPPAEKFTPTMTKAELPTHLDWRGTPADFAVKDQAQCGSCWAFATTGTLEGAWFVHTGQGRSFSEQQLVDCAWDEGPKGCDGGDAQPAFAYVVKSGGVAQTQDYPYKGLNGWCRDNSTRKEGFFKGFGQVPSRDEAAVMEALMRNGPLAVGVDADFDFSFYSEGVYREKRCALKPKNLNHAVLLVGWGTNGDGQDYWIVRNSWSKFWGLDGYIYLHRGGNDCGIASDAVYAKIDEKYEVPGAKSAAVKLAVENGARLAAREGRRGAVEVV